MRAKPIITDFLKPKNLITCLIWKLLITYNTIKFVKFKNITIHLNKHIITPNPSKPFEIIQADTFPGLDKKKHNS